MFAYEGMVFGKNQGKVHVSADPKEAEHTERRSFEQPETNAVDQITHLQAERPGRRSCDARPDEELYLRGTVIRPPEKDEHGDQEKHQGKEYGTPLGLQDGAQRDQFSNVTGTSTWCPWRTTM